jgi:hypothetical protein
MDILEPFITSVFHPITDPFLFPIFAIFAVHLYEEGFKAGKSLGIRYQS